MIKLLFSLSVLCVAATTGQRIMTIQLDGIQYYISRMNPYSPELNYYLAYQYCRSLGLQLASFDTKEKYLSMVQYLKNAHYANYDFWTSGNRLGTGMYLWMSSGLPFNATFDYFEHDGELDGIVDSVESNGNTAPQRTARDDTRKPLDKNCVLLKAPKLKWEADDCLQVKDFICEQTRCYYYNYGSIPVTSNQGRKYTGTVSTTAMPPHGSFKDTTAFYVSLMGSTKAPTSHEVEIEEEEEHVGSDETTTENGGQHDDEEVQHLDDGQEEHHTSASAEDDGHTESSEQLVSHEEIEEVPVEQRLRQLTDDLGRLKLDSNDDENRQSFLSLSDLIKTLRPNDDKPLQIDSSYSRSQVLGEKPDIVYHPRNAATGEVPSRSLFKK